MHAKTIVLAAATLVTAVGVGAGVILHSPDKTAPTAHATTTLAQVDTTTMVVARRPFCDGIAAADVTAALGGEATDASSYSDGDKASLTSPEGTVDDVAQEFGCTWTGTGTAARAWVFAPPVTPGWAGQLAAQVPKGCTRKPGPAYGRPSVALSCGPARTGAGTGAGTRAGASAAASGAPGATTVSLRGLFGDAWLSCELTGRPDEPAATVAARADRWCLAVARAAG